MHAALSGPARLHITGTLLAAGASPSELAAMLGDAVQPARPPPAGCSSRPGSSPAAPKGHHRRTCLRLIPGTLDMLSAHRHARHGGCSSCAPRTRPARIWRRRCGAGPVPCPRHRPEPTRPMRSRRVPSPPPDGTTCRCAACGPATSRGTARRRPHGHRLRPGARKTGSGRRCSGPSPTRSAGPRTSTLRWPTAPPHRTVRTAPGGCSLAGRPRALAVCSIGGEQQGSGQGAGANGDEHRRVAAGDGVQRCGGRGCRGLADDDRGLHATEAGEQGAGRTGEQVGGRCAGPETEAEQQHKKHDTGCIPDQRAAPAASMSAIAIASERGERTR